MKIYPDGSTDEPFSKNYKGKYPSYCGESCDDYREKVKECIKKGFDLGDLSWSDWHVYCGSEVESDSQEDEEEFNSEDDEEDENIDL